MDYKKFMSSWAGSRKLNTVFLICICNLTAANTVLVLLLAFNKEEIVLVPPHMNGEIRAAVNRTTESSARAWGLYFAGLLGNVTPDSLHFIKSALEPMVSPDVYQEVSSALAVQAEQIAEDHISMRFEPKIVQFEEKTKLVFITGRSIVKGPSGEEKRQDRTYEFKIDMNGYQPLLSWINTYEGGARTEKIKDRLERTEQRRLEKEQRALERTGAVPKKTE